MESDHRSVAESGPFPVPDSVRSSISVVPAASKTAVAVVCCGAGIPRREPVDGQRKGPHDWLVGSKVAVFARSLDGLINSRDTGIDLVGWVAPRRSRDDDVPRVRSEAVLLLGATAATDSDAGYPSLDDFRACLHDDSWVVRSSATEALASLAEPQPETVRPLIDDSLALLSPPTEFVGPDPGMNRWR
ncbi:HEAT repeat domain-containing protein [Natrinema sp. J7-2]|uniref:HEAT repeat domain-containing protein n=1 Tax=Natrinema sp. (strain J7-2) TaxID=406552 RepID=UPI0016512CA4|nr:HEAT repeat domain-containing protein [Natrinema sp. J7-2]